MKNIDPNLYSLAAVIIGYILTDDFSAVETNSLGNWFELLGQYLLTVSAQQTAIETNLQNIKVNINSRKAKTGGNYMEENDNSNQSLRNEIELLKKSLDRINGIIEDVKSKK